MPKLERSDQRKRFWDRRYTEARQVAAAAVEVEPGLEVGAGLETGAGLEAGAELETEAGLELGAELEAEERRN